MPGRSTPGLHPARPRPRRSTRAPNPPSRLPHGPSSGPGWERPRRGWPGQSPRRTHRQSDAMWAPRMPQTGVLKRRPRESDTPKRPRPSRLEATRRGAKCPPGAPLAQPAPESDAWTATGAARAREKAHTSGVEEQLARKGREAFLAFTSLAGFGNHRLFARCKPW
mgnify:CR=1 FL=1